jgi:hypothetical protein
MHFGENQLSLRSIGISPDYPQLIRAFFNIHRSGRPRVLTPASPWPWVDHAVSGLLTATIRPVRTRFRSACASETLRQLPPITRRVIMQKARHHPLFQEGSDCLRAHWFQVLFHSPPGVLFTFPSRYWCTIGGDAYLALGGGPPGFPQGSSCPVVLGDSLGSQQRSVRDSHPLRCAVPGTFPFPIAIPRWRTTTPHAQGARFRLVPVRSPLLGQSHLLSFPEGT